MPRYVTITADDLEVGMEITAWRASCPSSGQGGKVTRIGENMGERFLELRAGVNGEFQHTIAFGDVHHFTVERFLDADECVEFHHGNCAGVVDYCYAPSGSTIPRCQGHNDQRWNEYENDKTSVARYANSDLVPDWFDPSAIGESWDGE